MKNIFLILIVTFNLSNAFEVHKSKEFYKEIEPTKMGTSIVLNMIDKDKLIIQKAFKEAIDISNKAQICTNGSYRISPKYRYKDQDRVFVGYQGNLTFKCEFQDTIVFDKINSKLDEITIKKDALKLTINPIQWVIHKKVIEQTNEELELQALHFAKSYTKFLASVYAQQCKIKEVSLNQITRPIYQRSNYKSMAESASITTEPIKSNQTIKYSASYKFECDL